MSFRFWRRIRIAPGVTLNLSKSTASLSFGPRGAKYTVSPRGNRSTVGLPGTGLFYTVHEPRRPSSANAPRVAQRDRLDLGFFQRLFTPADERALVDGLKALHAGDEGAALGGLDRLGGQLDKYGIAAQVTFPVTPEVDAHARPRERGTRLALVEIAQLTGDLSAAMRHVERLLVIEPGDPVVMLSLAELILDDDADRAQLERVVALSVGIANETSVETALLLYRGRALARLGLADAAIDVFTIALRRRKDRADTLLRQLRYERSVLYDQVGRKAQARRELERVYAEDPGFEDVRERLGLGG